jgi:hypothetical protein
VTSLMRRGEPHVLDVAVDRAGGLAGAEDIHRLAELGREERQTASAFRSTGTGRTRPWQRPRRARANAKTITLCTRTLVPSEFERQLISPDTRHPDRCPRAGAIHELNASSDPTLVSLLSPLGQS